ncbi:hypothetical protein [Streptomyces sp. NBC_01320]|uniref:hypothetical protein n=1 Tax=Streptomyces sp. NBC_01320 TaxID=2903824 RepID=UPI002E0D27C5|nr:hypothetical protein OG395_03605 [Streptomyces sp. NBC_01320]
MHETPSLHRDLIDGRVRLPRVGAVVAGTTPSLPWLVVDAAGREIEPVSVYPSGFVHFKQQRLSAGLDSSW